MKILCRRCGAHFPLNYFNESQRGNNSPWCKVCVTWPAGQIPVRGMRYREYIDFKIQEAMKKPNPKMIHPDQLKNHNKKAIK